MTEDGESERLILIRAGQLLDGDQEHPRREVTLVIRGSVVEEIHPDWKLGARGAQLIEAPEATVLPGLIDSHVHLSIPFSPYDAEAHQLGTTDKTVARAAFFAVRNARRVLERGVTTVRDLGSHGGTVFALQRSIDAGELPGPRIVAAGPAISPTGGHFPIGSTVADGPEAVRAAARGQIAAGAGVLKVMASAGGVTPGRGAYAVLFSRDEIAAAVAEAGSRGVTIAAHAVNPEAATNAVQAGVNSIEHGVLIDEPVIDLMRERGTFFVPTLWVYRRTAMYGERFKSLAPAQLDELRDRLRRHAASVRRAHEIGVRIAAGSDAGTPAMPGDALAWELEWLVSCGLSPTSAIHAATRDASDLLGLSDTTGRLRPGMTADVVIVNGDPLQRVGDIRQVDVVLQGGKAVVIDGESTLEPDIVDPHPFPDGPYPQAEGASPA